MVFWIAGGDRSTNSEVILNDGVPNSLLLERFMDLVYLRSRPGRKGKEI